MAEGEKDDSLLSMIKAGAAGEAIDDRLHELLFPLSERKDFHALADTESVDDVLRLVRQRLPEWRIDRLCENAFGRYFACLEHRSRKDHLLNTVVAFEGPSFARALLGALLKALAAQATAEAA